MNGKRYCEEEIEFLKKLYNEGYTARQISNAINQKFHNGKPIRSLQSVKQKAHRVGGVKSRYYEKTKNGLYYCSHCRKYKDANEFRINRSTKYGIHNICSFCESQYRIYGVPKHKTEFL